MLHGGEPLLAGAPRLARDRPALRAAVEPCALDLRIHTNGVRLDEEFCELFLAERIKVGISLDGDRAANDLHRRFADGRSSYDQALRAVDLLRGTGTGRSTPACCAPSTCAATRPPSTERWPTSIRRPSISCCRTPPGTTRRPAQARGTPYADWLAAVYEAWQADGSRVPVRIFDSISRPPAAAPA